MASVLETAAAVEGLSTSFDPYGQLVKMLLPRASSIAIYDRMSQPVWTSAGCDDHDLAQLAEEALNVARQHEGDAEEREGFARSWEGDSSYVFILRDDTTLLGALALSCQDASSGTRPFNAIKGLLRPALQVLGREMLNQNSIGDLRKDLVSRDGDLSLLLGASGPTEERDGNFASLLKSCVEHMQCLYGALLVPDKRVELSYCAPKSKLNTRLLEKTQRNLFAWAQVQRRTLLLNKAPPNSPLSALPYKLLACPVRHGTQHVTGLLLLAKPVAMADFDSRQARLVELITRRIASVLQNAYDPTTGLLTRTAFEQRALATLSSLGTGTQHCVAYADIDRLHIVNENHGMHIGDDVIRRAAAALRDHMPPNAVAARISGDRFALFFPQTSLGAAQSFVETICTRAGDVSITHEGKSIELSLSIGVAPVTSAKYPLSHALAAAEIACKAAKDRGRGRVESYQDADQSIVRRYEDIAIIGTVREAISNDRFRMEAQPIMQLDSTTGPRRFELLLRMIDKAGETVTPDKFLSAAERYQLGTDIDRWVVQYTLEILSSAAPALESIGAHFAVNISGQSLGDEEFPAFLEGKLREYALPPQLLSFEITETAAVANIVRAQMLIQRLQELGHNIALDDFGRGLSSLTYLKTLSVSHLKIDGDLVRDLVGNTRSQAMITAIVQLAQAMKLHTTAECVESDAIMETLRRLGVEYGQGFAIGRPRPLETTLRELLRDMRIGTAANIGSGRIQYAAGA